MGAAGNMITAALLELINDKTDFLKQINSIGLSNVEVTAEPVMKCGIAGTHIQVIINGEEESNAAHTPHNKDDHSHFVNHILNRQSHANIKKIENALAELSISQKVRDNAAGIYRVIAEAEAEAHGCPIEDIHFHEIGAADAIADIVGACMLMEHLKPQEVVASPINVGSGFVRCQHGLLPVPAPATARILQDVPIYNAVAHDELCTPTGAAIVKYFATSFGKMPEMRVKKIGYGMGTKDFEAANCVRVFLGETQNSGNKTNEVIVKLECNLDDMTGEAVGFAVKLLLQKGALDVFTSPIYMKKNRPAILLACICNEESADFFAKLILRHTSTFGVRKTVCSRYALKHKISTRETSYGNMRVKIGEGYNLKKLKPEYDDIANAASVNDASFNEVDNAAKQNSEGKNDEYKTKI
jgi:uncharacterized protein (TIGR00299 family) protein